MIGRLLSSGILAAAMSSLGIRTTEKLEKKLAGGRALSVRGLMARRTVLAAMMRELKRQHSKQG